MYLAVFGFGGSLEPIAIDLEMQKPCGISRNGTSYGGVAMIEFKGAYFNKTTNESKSVLVQFDGVLLHVWQITDPFCRLLTSDVFTLSAPLRKAKRSIKLPNGGRIETSDIKAFITLQSNCQANLNNYANRLLSQRRLLWLVCGFALLAGTLLLLNMVHLG